MFCFVFALRRFVLCCCVAAALCVGFVLIWFVDACVAIAVLRLCFGLCCAVAGVVVCCSVFVFVLLCVVLLCLCVWLCVVV